MLPIRQDFGHIDMVAYRHNDLTETLFTCAQRRFGSLALTDLLLRLFI